MAEAEDGEITQRAREEERVVATLDADFHALLVLSRKLASWVVADDKGCLLRV